MNARSPYEGGFADQSIDAAKAFRACLEALARPGRIEQIAGAKPPAPLSVAAGSLLLTLCDQETPVHLAASHAGSEIADWLRFQTGAPLVPAEKAQFAIGHWEALQPLDRYRVGTPEYPDQSATLIVECPDLGGSAHKLTGPGIETAHYMNLPDLAAFQVNSALFPLGLDFYFTAGDRLAGLPRTTQVEAA
ncbi:MAG: phosphonate C-P lyase system protein PhnH [Pseudomonadota bacterium]